MGDKNQFESFVLLLNFYNYHPFLKI